MQKTNLIKDMVNKFLNKLNPDFSNIDEVYSELLNEYISNGNDRTETIFIDSLSLVNLSNDDANISNLEKYLDKKKINVKSYELIGFYNYYIETKRFALINPKAYKSEDFEYLNNKLNEHQKQYEFIYERLTESQRIEFKNDFSDRLKKLIEIQNLSKFKEIFRNLNNNIIQFAEYYTSKTIVSNIDKKEREFLIDLNENKINDKIPYVELFKNDEDLRSKFFEDYLKTELKPNFIVYSEKYLTADEFSKRNNRKKEDDLFSKYNELISNKQLPQEFYTHHISETNIFKKLSFIKLKINDFYKTTTTNNPNEYATNFAKKVICILDSLSLPKLKKEILNNFINDEENAFLTIEFIILNNPNNISKDKALTDFRDLKMFADNYIVDHLKNNTSTNENEVKSERIADVNIKIEVWKSEFELRQFIDLATRWDLNGVYRDRTDENPYYIFKDYISYSRQNFELFSSQLNQKLIANDNWRAIEINLKYKFLSMLNQYIEWYNLNKQEIEKFNPYNPYELMFSIIESTKNEILKYFPDIELDNLQISNKNTSSIQSTNLSKVARLNMNVIALMYVYNEIFITRDNADDIAKKYYYISNNSGEKLYQKFISYQNRTDRKANPQSKIKLKNKIKLFETVIELLTNEISKAKANSELTILKNFESEYL